MGIDNIRKIKSDALLPKEKKYYRIKPISEKRKKLLAEQRESGSDSSLDIFYSEMRKKLKGKCIFCGGKTTKDNDEFYRAAIAHLLPKNIFKSVATNSENWIELCLWNNSCHQNFDSGKISWEFIKDSKEWEFIKEKLLIVLPQVAMAERKNKLYDKLETLVYKKLN